MTFIKKETETQAKQAQPREELLKLIAENCSNEDLAIFAKLVQNPPFKKLALDYLKVHLK